MKKIFFLIFFISIILKVSAQNPAALTSILDEGKMLYKSEMASWYGTDLMLEKFKEKKEQIAGYFSYPDGNDYSCVFFSKGEKPNIILKISFDESYALDKAKFDNQERALNKNEEHIYTVRKAALNALNTDTVFKHYNNASLNVIPIVTKKNTKVYVLTAPKVNGVVILGNDYLILFNQKNEITKVTKLHQNIIPINYSKDKETISMHTHAPETGESITSTDICTLMLYGKFTNWSQHYVLSKSQVSIWDIAKNDVVTLTREAWEKIAKDQNERHPNSKQ